MDWDLQQQGPIYLQIEQQLTKQIVSGKYPPGSRLPAVRELAMEAGVNPNTMQRALSEMEREGLLYSIRTSGRFVTQDSGAVQEVKRRLAKEELGKVVQSLGDMGFSQEEIRKMMEEELACRNK